MLKKRLKKCFFIWKSLPLYQSVLNVRRTNIRGNNYLGNKLCIGICLNSCFLSIPHILDIDAKKHKILWNINGINYVSIPFMVLSLKSLECAHRINRKAELKKKKRTRKDTENVEALEMSMEMTISVTNKLVENLFHEITVSLIRLVAFEVWTISVAHRFG